MRVSSNRPQAARNIMQPENVIGVAGSGRDATVPLEGGRKPRIRGEVLRSRRNPSVTELLTKRAEGTAQQAQKLDQFMGVDALRHGCEFVTLLAEWDRPSTAVPAARSLMDAPSSSSATPTASSCPRWHESGLRDIPQLTQLRMGGGDTNALVEYAAWIKAADPQKLDTYALDAFAPLWRNPSDPTLAPVADWLFNDPASPWSALPWQAGRVSQPADFGPQGSRLPPAGRA